MDAVLLLPMPEDVAEESDAFFFVLWLALLFMHVQEHFASYIQVHFALNNISSTECTQFSKRCRALVKNKLFNFIFYCLWHLSVGCLHNQNDGVVHSVLDRRSKGCP